VSRASEYFDYEEIPGGDGWYSWNPIDRTRFNYVVLGELITRREDETCRLRMIPQHRHTNLQEMIHGATTLALIDIALFATVHLLGTGEAGPSVTLELSTQFVGAGKPDRPLDAVTEIVRETGRMVFLRGQVVQEDHLVASFSGIVRKLSSRGGA
jgi:uncharacterized protein (TIGR00369 family)